MNDEDEFLTTDEVAAMTRAPASTVRYWRHMGIGPDSFHVGRRVLYRRSLVVAWLHAEEDAERRPAS